MKNPIFILILLSLSGSTFAIPSDPKMHNDSKSASQKPKPKGYPRFSKDGRYIHFTASVGWCGGMTITPKSNLTCEDNNSRFKHVQLQSWNDSKGWVGKTYDVNKKIGTDEKLEFTGERYKYSNAGIIGDAEWRIYCFEVCSGPGGGDIITPGDCKKLVRVSDVEHDKQCLIKSIGTEAGYGDLKMKD